MLPSITPLTKKKVLYSDFHKDLTINPITDDLALLINEDSVKESIKNLIFTDRGERLFQPTVGCGIRQTLFDLMTPATLKVLEEQIREVINTYEPRAELIDVIVKGLYEENRVEVAILFYVQNNEKPVSMTVLLERTR